MICLRCDNEEFVLQPDALIDQEFKGQGLQIQMPAWVCSQCGWTTLDFKQANELRQRTATAYASSH